MKSSLSPIELSFWYQYKYSPSSDAQNIIHHVVVSGSYSDKQIQHAFTTIIQKYAVLRSRFKEIDGTPYRYIQDEATFDYTDGTLTSEGMLLEQARRPFVLEKDNLVRVSAKRSEVSTTLLITIGHIIFDAFSWNIFRDELIRNLKGVNVGNKTVLPLYPAAQEEAQSYWSNRLRNIDGRVNLERIQTQTEPSTLDTITQNGMHTLFSRLSEFGKLHGLSMNTLCMTILSITLSKLTATQRMIIATPVTTREENSIDHIGSYINVLPSVIEVQPNSSFMEHAMTTATMIWDDIENRNLSLIDILSSTPTVHHTDNQGIYNVMAEYVPAYTPSADIIEDVIVPNIHTKMDIIFSIIANADDHLISVEFDASKFSRQYIKTITKTFVTIASSILNDPNQVIKSIRMMSVQEEKELLSLGQGPIKEIQPPYIWNRFKDVALKQPDRVAVTDANGSTTYGELLTLSKKYAGFFRANGIKENKTVGIFMERGVEYIASMLALWSVGAIYVPLDPQQPSARLESMIKQARIEAVVINQPNNLPIGEVLYLNITTMNDVDVFESDFEPQGEDTAYIIFTSGSTGTPKGVVIQHKGFLNHLEIMIQILNMSPRDVIAQTASPSFDISVWQLVGALIVGASLVVVGRDQLIDPDQMYRIVKEKSITVLEVVPSLISGYLSNEEGHPELAGQLNGLKIITTGEAISTSIISQWMNVYPSTPLYNAYGPAEASDDTHMYIIEKNPTSPNESVPIGRPLQNVRTYIVNHDMQLAPRGIVGEICIGGPVVAGGYISDTELSEHSFLPDSISQIQGRLYRTGDYGKWNEDGTLSYHGRKDHQVKVRGQRLELGEIEEQLKKVKGVIDAAVTAHAGKNGTKLNGYIVIQDKTMTAGDIKARLHSLLPEFMIPQTLEIIGQLPRSNNGKLDRMALENYKMSTQNEPSVLQPQQYSPTLRTIISVYSQVLDTEVNQSSNYFDCGGDSLQSMRITSLLNKHNIAVGIRDILLYQTPMELAQHVDTQVKEALKDQTTLQPLDSFTPIQEAYLQASGSDYRDSGEIQAVVLTLIKPLTPAELSHYLLTITKAHAELMPLETSAPLVVENSWKNSEALEDITEAIRRKISLETPLVACILSEKELLIVAHHFILDFHSWTLIQSDLSTLISNPNATLEHENILKKWWGNALKKLNENNDALKDAQDFWQATISESSPRQTTSETRRHIIECVLPSHLINSLIQSSVSLESFAYYVYVLAAATANKETDFSYSIESSLRTIDSTNTLHHGIGWMTYMFTQMISRHTVSRDALLKFHLATTDSLTRGYEYGLLRYIVCPEYFKNAQSPTWVLNYLGSAIIGIDEAKVIETIPRKSIPFVEVDIHDDNGKLLFDHYDNLDLTDNYFELLGNEIEHIIASLANEYKNLSDINLSSKRSAAILARIKNANRN